LLAEEKSSYLISLFIESAMASGEANPLPPEALEGSMDIMSGFENLSLRGQHLTILYSDSGILHSIE
jgi:hypothetical protein